MSESVLISWIARNNDPFERERDGSYRLDKDRNRIPGPTLNLLFSESSPYKGRITEVVLFARIPPGVKKKDRDHERHILEETSREIRSRAEHIQVEKKYWPGTSPIDHREIFAFLKARIPEIRRQYPDRELLINVSPGTPAMHTIWVLMAETGYIEPPFSVVQTIPASFRQPDEPAVIPVDVGIDTFYKAYRVSKPLRSAAQEESVFWDPTRFKSNALRQVFTEARRFAGLNIPVLILGERGTGKTTLASWIRTHSPFRRQEQDASWPSVPCGQYTSETMRAELFGYKKGAFTGATQDYDGLLAAANGDTLFLDEIGDISSDLQRLLIRAVEEGSYTPMGSTELMTSDFRLIAATNKPWEVLETHLDADFLDRISVLVLQMPALREIPEDMDWIWVSVFEQAVGRAGIDYREVNIDADLHTTITDQLRMHALPGNLRDVFRVAYRLIAALWDPLEPVDAESAVRYAVETGLRAAQTSGADHTRQIVKAFLQNAPLDDLVDDHEIIRAKEMEVTLRQYLGRELRNLAKRRGVKPETLCDVGNRTLLNWEKGE